MGNRNVSRCCIFRAGTCRWLEFGEGGLLWGECNAKHFEWFDGDPVNELLCKVKEVYGLEDQTAFRNVTVATENRPSPLNLETAIQIVTRRTRNRWIIKPANGWCCEEVGND